MNKIFVIAEDVSTNGEGEYNVETVVCHNLGCWTKEEDAKLKCTEYNAKAMGEDDDPENWQDIYYVLEMKVNS